MRGKPLRFVGGERKKVSFILDVIRCNKNNMMIIMWSVCRRGQLHYNVHKYIKTITYMHILVD